MTTKDESEETAIDLGTLLSATNDVWDPSTIQYFGLDNRSMLLAGEITDVTSSAICSQIWTLEQDEEVDKAFLYINCPGGSIYDMWAIYDVMRLSKLPIYTIGYGLVGSAAFLIFNGGDKRVCTENCQFFYHEPIMATEATQELAIKNTSELYASMKERYNKIIKGRSKIPSKIWKEKFENNTSTYFNAQQALEWGIVDEIISAENKNKITNKKWI